MSMSELLEKAVALREKKRELDAESKEVGKEYDAVCAEIMASMDTEGLTKTAVGNITASISVQLNPSVTDWDAFGDYILEHKALHLLQRRASSTAYRELLEEGIAIPGVEPFDKRVINLRAS